MGHRACSIIDVTWLYKLLYKIDEAASTAAWCDQCLVHFCMDLSTKSGPTKELLCAPGRISLQPHDNLAQVEDSDHDRMTTVEVPVLDLLNFNSRLRVYMVHFLHPQVCHSHAYPSNMTLVCGYIWFGKWIGWRTGYSCGGCIYCWFLQGARGFLFCWFGFRSTVWAHYVASLLCMLSIEYWPSISPVKQTHFEAIWIWRQHGTLNNAAFWCWNSLKNRTLHRSNSPVSRWTQ